jgi:hypothetical protein
MENSLKHFISDSFEVFDFMYRLFFVSCLILMHRRDVEAAAPAVVAAPVAVAWTVETALQEVRKIPNQKKSASSLFST